MMITEGFSRLCTTIHSNNIYQIFSYVKNKDVKHDGSVSGILLYAKTEDEKALDEDYRMSGNSISVKTLDLNQEFSHIKDTLDRIAENVKTEPRLLNNRR